MSSQILFFSLYVILGIFSFIFFLRSVKRSGGLEGEEFRTALVCLFMSAFWPVFWVLVLSVCYLSSEEPKR